MADIAYKRDVDRIVAERLGWSIEKVTHHSNFFFKRMKKIMKDPAIDSIKIFPIGTMNTKANHIRQRVNKAKFYGEEIPRHFSEKSRRYKKIFDEIKEVPYKRFLKFNRRMNIKSFWLRAGKNIKQLEDYQNEQDWKHD